MGLFEFLMLFCFCFSWPFSIVKSYRSRSTKGKSLLFMLLIIAGYAFGILHKMLYSFNWVIWAYVTGMALVSIDLILYLRNRCIERREDAAHAKTLNGKGER